MLAADRGGAIVNILSVVSFFTNPVNGKYAGAYWTGTDMAVLDELGTELDDALAEFREELRQHGEL